MFSAETKFTSETKEKFQEVMSVTKELYNLVTFTKLWHFSTLKPSFFMKRNQVLHTSSIAVRILKDILMGGKSCYLTNHFLLLLCCVWVQYPTWNEICSIRSYLTCFVHSCENKCYQVTVHTNPKWTLSCMIQNYG